MKIKNYIREFVADDEREFESGHASTLVQLSNGDVFAAWFGGSWEAECDTAIWGARRISGVWEKPRKLADAYGIPMWNPVLFRKENGNIVLFYKVGKTISQWKTWFIESSNNGESFSEPREMVPGDDSGGRGPVKNKPIRLQNGTVLAPASVEGEVWDAFVDMSEDDCKTWSKSEFVPVRRVKFDLDWINRPYNKQYLFGKGIIQPTLWEDKVGIVHMFLRSSSSRIFRSDSFDGGHTWCTAYDTGLPNNNSGIDITQMRNGDLVLVYNPRENIPGHSCGPRTPLVVAVSKDNGESFEELITLEGERGNYCYPSVICNEDNEIMITYTWNRENIVFCKMEYEE